MQRGIIGLPYQFSTAPSPKDQGTLKEDSKSQRPMKSVERLCILDMTETALMKYQQHDCLKKT